MCESLPALAPREPIEGRRNHRQLYLIERDGTVREIVRLHIPDMRVREQVICLHYLKMLVRHVLKDAIGVNVISRDEPWDFRLELSTGNALTLEVTAIADNEHQFKSNSRENWRDILSHQPKIELRQLEKIERLFPETEIRQLIARLKAAGTRPGDSVDNPDLSKRLRRDPAGFT